jgi:predicted metalloprotease
MGIPLGAGGILLLLVLSWVTGTNFFTLLGGVSSGPTVTDTAPVESSAQEEQLLDMVGAVMEDSQDTWQQLLPNRYEQTRVVVFRDAIQSACGFAESASGPFYCPADRKVYLDLGFFDELHNRFGAPGDFAQAYVLAHEVGHHVQTLLGTSSQVRSSQRERPGQANALSVALELQADCFAGVWGHHAAQPGRYLQGKVELEAGDVEEGLNAAAAIGDDRLQRMSTGRVVPDSFTHGSSEQRVTWFRRGLGTGDPGACNTFQVR